MAGRDGTSGDNKDFKMVLMADSKGKPVLDGKGKPVMIRKFLTKSEKEGMKAPKTQTATTTKPTTSSRGSSAPSTSKRPQARNNVAQIAQGGLDKAERGPSRRAGPRRQAVATQERPSGPKGASGATYGEWKEMSRAERKAAGLPVSSWGGAVQAWRKAGGLGNMSADTGMAKGGMVGKSGYAKGGMVKSNCGASMKPTQKSSKGK